MDLSVMNTWWYQGSAVETLLVLASVSLAILILINLCRRSSPDSFHDAVSDDGAYYHTAKSEASSDLGEQLIGDVEAITTEPLLCQDWTRAEDRAIREFLRTLPGNVERPPPGMLLQVVWARGLDAPAACRLWQAHIHATGTIGVDKVDDANVRAAYLTQKFCVPAGRDVDGRAMIWVRMGLVDPASLTPPLTVRNTWLAQDAVLSQGADVNRKGICFVYDLSGVGASQVNRAMASGWWNPKWVRHALMGGPSHPSHISRVWLLDAPPVFVKIWDMTHHFLPAYIREVVRFHRTDATNDRAASLAAICPNDQLPVYLGGDVSRFGGSFAEWMFRRLEGQPLIYRRLDPR